MQNYKMSTKLSSLKFYRLLKKTTTCTMCLKRFTGAKAKPETKKSIKDNDPFCKLFLWVNYFWYPLIIYFWTIIFLVAPYSQSAKDQQRLYVWGMAEHGALGDLKIRSRENRIRFIYRPVRLKFAYSHKVRKNCISCIWFYFFS